MANKPVYDRILLKLSGEALMGKQPFGIDPDMMRYVAEEVVSVHELGVQLALVAAHDFFSHDGVSAAERVEV